MPVTLPRIAVLLAAYNGMQWIEDQLASILAQTAVDVTVYISVDPSTDGTEAWCHTYAAQHPRVIVLSPAGAFGGASRNFFRLIRDVDLIEFDLVAFADQDDVWHADKLQRAAQLIQSRGVDACSTNVTAFWPDGRNQLLDKAQPQVAWDYLFEAAGPGCTYVLSRKLVAALKVSMLASWDKLQAINLHDWYCYAFARGNGFRWFIDPNPSMQYRQHDRNQFGANTGISSWFARYKMIRSGWWFSQVRLIAELVEPRRHPLISERWPPGRWQLLRLSLNAGKCRRRGRDKFFFLLICWVAAVIGIGAS
jgi:rhamnosyltransferase